MIWVKYSLKTIIFRQNIGFFTTSFSLFPLFFILLFFPMYWARAGPHTEMIGFFTTDLSFSFPVLSILLFFPINTGRASCRTLDYSLVCFFFLFLFLSLSFFCFPPLLSEAFWSTYGGMETFCWTNVCFKLFLKIVWPFGCNKLKNLNVDNIMLQCSLGRCQ